MSKKFAIILFLITFMFTYSFAERRTRVDTYGSATAKIIWDSTYTLGPNNLNWAENEGIDLYSRGWQSVLTYNYLLNPNKSICSSVKVCLYTYLDTSYYSYRVVSWRVTNGVSEKVSSVDFFTYGEARYEFDFRCKVLEDLI